MMKVAIPSECIPLDGQRRLIGAPTPLAEMGDINTESEFTNCGEMLGRENEMQVGLKVMGKGISKIVGISDNLTISFQMYKIIIFPCKVRHISKNR